MRILAACRISKDTEASDSVEGQETAIRAWAAANRHTVVDATQDTDVSGSIPPVLRDKLGPWLAPGKLATWDAIVVTKVDRFSRSLRDFLAFRDEFCSVNGKQLISLSEDVSGLNGTMLAVFADHERKRIAERRAERAERSRQRGEWDGRSVCPGYRPVRVNSHYELTLNESDEPYRGPHSTKGGTKLVKASTIRDMAEAVINGMSARQAARVYGISNPIAVLRNEGLRGYVMHGGRPVYDGGVIVRRPAVVLDDLVWHKTQAALDRQSVQVTRRREGMGFGVQVMRCAACGAPLYALHTQGRKPVYRHETGAGCKAPVIPADMLEETVSAAVLAVMGDLPELHQVVEPGESHDTEIARYRELIDGLDKAHETGDVTDRTYYRQSAKLEAELERLEALPSRPTVVSMLPTGRTYGELWAGMTEVERGDWLRSQGIVAWAVRTPTKRKPGAAGLVTLAELTPAAPVWPGRCGTDVTGPRGLVVHVEFSAYADWTDQNHRETWDVA